MASFVKEIIIHDTQQLVDINGDAVNFNAECKVTSDSDQEFEMVITNQEFLDSGNELQFHKAKKEISGNFTSDKNIYQNHYMVLKSTSPMNVRVEVNIEPLPMKNLNPVIESPKYNINWKYILIGISIVIVGASIYYYIYYYNTKKSKYNFKPKISISNTIPREFQDSPYQSPINSPIQSPVNSPIQSPVNKSINNSIESPDISIKGSPRNTIPSIRKGSSMSYEPGSDNENFSSKMKPPKFKFGDASSIIKKYKENKL